uniref:Uncharacterized protein n=1 Tax=Anguilla anguilla TaxID=7936 RepID=A0A0E9TTT8_ANGAN
MPALSSAHVIGGPAPITHADHPGEPQSSFSCGTHFTADTLQDLLGSAPHRPQ